MFFIFGLTLAVNTLPGKADEPGHDTPKVQALIDLARYAALSYDSMRFFVVLEDIQALVDDQSAFDALSEALMSEPEVAAALERVRFLNIRFMALIVAFEKEPVFAGVRAVYAENLACDDETPKDTCARIHDIDAWARRVVDYSPDALRTLARDFERPLVKDEPDDPHTAIHALLMARAAMLERTR